MPASDYKRTKMKNKSIVERLQESLDKANAMLDESKPKSTQHRRCVNLIKELTNRIAVLKGELK
jgi:excinuclease UvrABC ATPase subunit